MHDRSGFTSLLGVAVALAVSSPPALAGKPTGPACAGRYLVAGKAPLIEGGEGPGVDVVVVSPSGVTLGSCSSAAARMNPLRDGWKLRADWPACGGVPGARHRGGVTTHGGLPPRPAPARPRHLPTARRPVERTA